MRCHSDFGCFQTVGVWTGGPLPLQIKINCFIDFINALVTYIDISFLIHFFIAFASTSICAKLVLFVKFLLSLSPPDVLTFQLLFSFFLS